MSEFHKGQVEEILRELGKKIDLLIVDAKKSTEEVREDVEEKIVALKARKEKLEREFEDFQSNNDGKWQEIKLHLSKAADEIKMAAETAFKKK